MLLILVITLYGAGCGKKQDSDIVADSWIDEKTVAESESEKDISVMGEILTNAQIPEIEGEELTTDEQLANLILEKTLVEETDKDENFLYVKITYPDVGALLFEIDMRETPYGEEELLEMLLQSLKKDQVEYVTEEFKIMYEDDTDKQEIVWDEKLMNAMSGGLFGLFSEQEQ